jgi:hypothetical protein
MLNRALGAGWTLAAITSEEEQQFIADTLIKPVLASPSIQGSVKLFWVSGHQDLSSTIGLTGAAKALAGWNWGRFRLLR